MLDINGKELNGHCGLEGDKVSDMDYCPMICGDEDNSYCAGDTCDIYVIKGNTD